MKNIAPDKLVHCSFPRPVRQTNRPLGMLRYPLFTHCDLGRDLAWRSGRGVTAAQFLAASAELASRLPAKRYVLNLCHDRYCFLVGFAAALLAGQVSLMPNSRAGNALRQIYCRYPDAYCFSDHADVPLDLPQFSFPHDLDESARRTVVPSLPADQIAAIVFTSGSTGRPTPHPKTWESLVRGAEALGRQFGMKRDAPCIVVGTVPAQHMYGLETTVMFPLQWGWVVHTGSPVFPADLRGDLGEFPIPGWLMTTPLHLRACVAQHVALPGLEGIVSATMPLLPGLAREAEHLWGVPVHEIYGCTEGGMIASRRTTADESWKVCEGLRVWQDGAAAWVEGGHVGYPLHLADRIGVRNEQEFVLHGPANDLVKVAGKRTSLRALNMELTRIAGVLDGVFCVPDILGSGRERLAAIAVAPGQTPSSILTELRKRIDPVFLPRPLCLVDALPRNATGKLPRESLRALVTAQCGPGRRRSR